MNKLYKYTGNVTWVMGRQECSYEVNLIVPNTDFRVCQ